MTFKRLSAAAVICDIIGISWSFFCEGPPRHFSDYVQIIVYIRPLHETPYRTISRWGTAKTRHSTEVTIQTQSLQERQFFSFLGGGIKNPLYRFYAPVHPLRLVRKFQILPHIRDNPPPGWGRVGGGKGANRCQLKILLAPSTVHFT